MGLASGIREKRYLCGVLPVGEAFVVWSKTARPWLEEPLRVFNGDSLSRRNNLMSHRVADRRGRGPGGRRTLLRR